VYGGESGPNNDTQVSQCKNDKIKERKNLHMEMEKEIVFLKKDVNEFLGQGRAGIEPGKAD
jgi:hypothetical protein